jgi:putative sterol carrier protein
MGSKHVVIALVSIFITGLVLVISANMFAIQMAGLTASADVMAFLQNIILALIIGGLFAILIGLWQASRMMKTIAIEVQPVAAAAQVVQAAAPVVVQAAAAPAAPAGLGGGLKIIRPEMSKVEEKPAPASAPKAAAPAAAPAAAAAKPAAAAPVNMTFDEALQNIVDRYNTEKVKKSFKGWVNSLNMTFPDLNRSVIYAVNGDEGITMSDGIDEGAAVKVKLGSDVFVKMLTKQINPIKAYSSGNLEVKGEMKNMLKLRQLMF